MGTHPIFESDFDCLTDMSRLVLTRIPRAILSTRTLKPTIGNVRFFSATQSLSNAPDTKKLIMQMRKETSLPLKNCREALVETNWDFEAAKLYLKKEAKRLGLKKMASLASRTTSEGLVGGKSTGNKAALLILNCETEPVAKTSEFNQLLDSLLDILLQQPAGNYQNERFVEIEGVKDELAAAIGLIRENITVKKGMVIEGENIGIYVRSTNKDYPAHGSYGSLINLDGGDNDLASNLAKHCVLELPDKTGKIPKFELKNDEVKNDEYRLLYQSLNGGNEIVFNALKRNNAELKSWSRFHISG